MKACVCISAVFLMTAFLTDVAAIWCFQCNSNYDESCAALQPYETNSTYHRLCRDEKNTHKEFFCRKIIQTIHDRDDLVRVVRSCGYVTDPKNRSCYSLGSAGHKSVVCTCNTDSCNSAPLNYMPAALLSATTLLVVLRSL